MRRTLLSLSLVLLLARISFGQANEETQRQAAPVDAYQMGWQPRNAMSEAELWRQLSEQSPRDVNSQFNWYRSERNARLDRNNGQLSSTDRQELERIAEKVEAADANSFESHMTGYYADFPAPQAFTSLRAAAVLGPDRQELIAPMLNLAHMSGDKGAQDTWTRALDTQGILSPAYLQAASDLLLSVDRDGILFTNGDMDTHPLLVLQRRKDERRDVLLVDQRLLADAQYRQRIWSEARAKGPVPGAGTVFARTLTTATDRPVFLAMGMDRSWLDAFEGRLSTSGTAFRIGAGLSMAQLDERWKLMKKPTGAGPLSRNYLLPGAVLLKAARAKGDEARSAQLELELRRMARALGAEQDLLKAGVLQH
ncbi:MAG TPA: hypothetical protein VGE21_15945 [Flavobacteriales bacterium]